MPDNTISISVVVYHTDLSMLERNIQSIIAAVLYVRKSRDCVCLLYVIDNSESDDYFSSIENLLTELSLCSDVSVNLLKMPSNIGYGAANNVVISATISSFHLILNPDVVLEERSFAESLECFEANTAVGLIAPFTQDFGQVTQYTAKEYPNIFTLMLRIIDNKRFNNFFEKRLSSYELRSVVHEKNVVEIPIASGCFMFCRTKLLQQLGGFDERYFLYFEDFQLSLDMAKKAKVVFVPSVKIYHGGGKASRKGLWHIYQFIVSGVRFFQRNGWKFF